MSSDVPYDCEAYDLHRTHAKLACTRRKRARELKNPWRTWLRAESWSICFPLLRFCRLRMAAPLDVLSVIKVKAAVMDKYLPQSWDIPGNGPGYPRGVSIIVLRDTVMDHATPQIATRRNQRDSSKCRRLALELVDASSP